MRNYEAELARCDREIEACRAYDGPPCIGVTLGEIDWITERELIEAEREAA